MLDNIYHITLALQKHCIFSIKMSRFCHILRNVIMDFALLNPYTTSGLSILLQGVISLPDETSCD